MNDNIRDILDNIDNGWKKDVIIKYIYDKLALFFEKDLEYFLASEEEQARQYEMGFINKGRYVVCSTLVDEYVSVYQMLGIGAKKIISTTTWCNA